MNDRFRFRAFDKQDKELIYEAEHTYDCQSRNGYIIWHDNFACLLDDEERYTVEQCTGLKDKNGKLIYEGDIVKTEDGDILGIKWGKTGFNTPELFTSVGFIMSIRTSWGEDYMQFDKEEPYYEVIGNIHENPELLEEK